MVIRLLTAILLGGIVGFQRERVGAGAILKRREEDRIEGLTTAAGILMTAAAGVAAGLGRIGLALLSVVLAWVILTLIGSIEPHRAKAWASGNE